MAADPRAKRTARRVAPPSSDPFGLLADLDLSGLDAWPGEGIVAALAASGLAGGAVLAGCWPKGSLRSAGPLAVVFAEWPAQWPDPTAATASLGRLHRSIGRSLGMGAFHAALPEEEQLAAVRGLCEMDRVEALVRAGMPALAPADQPELWGEAADW
jgi:hypothetical protein